MQHQYSDLEVAPSNGADAPEAVKTAEEKIVVPRANELNEQKIHNGQDDDWSPDEKMMTGTEAYAPHKQPIRRFCGFRCSRRRMNVLIVLVVLIIVAAAVGGGVGGSLASRNKSSTATSPSGSDLILNDTATMTGVSSPTDTPTPTTTIEVTITTSTIDVSPSETAFRDCPSSDGTAYGVDNGSGDSPALIFRKTCGASYGTLSPLTITGEKASSLNDCIRMCVAQNTLNQTQNENNPCNTVCWRNGTPGDDLPFHCFGGFKANDTQRFAQVSEERCDSATWINQGNGTDYDL